MKIYFIPFLAFSIGAFIGLYGDLIYKLMIIGLKFETVIKIIEPKLMYIELLLFSLNSVIVTMISLYYVRRLNKLEKQLNN